MGKEGVEVGTKLMGRNRGSEEEVREAKRGRDGGNAVWRGTAMVRHTEQGVAVSRSAVTHPAIH